MYFTKVLKRSLIILSVVFLHTNYFFAQSNLEIANNYYDIDDYSNSVEYFKKTIFEDKNYNGVVFYRYAYSLEQNGSNESVYAPYYAASAYCFERTKDLDEKYYSYAVAKEEKLKISHKKFGDKTIDKLVAGKTIYSFEYKSMESFWLIISICFIVLAYVMGRYFSENTDCVIFSSNKEIKLLFLPFFVIIFSMFGDNREVGNLPLYLIIVSLSITLISIIGYSIYNNRNTEKPVFYTFISSITKIALFIITPIVIFFALCAFQEEKKDGRYRDGTKNNQKTRNRIFLLGVLSSLIGFVFMSLIMKNSQKYFTKTL